MARPSTHADLATEDLRYEVAEISTKPFLIETGVLKAYAAFIDAYLKIGGIVERGYSDTDIKIYMPNNEDDRDSRLRLRQREWDSMRDKYEACAIEQTEPERWERSDMREWCRRESLPLPYESDKDTAELLELLDALAPKFSKE
jgi:hypothetical protein